MNGFAHRNAEGDAASSAEKQATTTTVKPLSARWPYRWYAIPAAVAAGLWLLAAITTATSVAWLATATAALIAAAGITVVWLAPSQMTDRRRILITAAAGTAVAWLTLAAATAPWQRTTATLLGLAAAAATVVWTRLPAIKARVRADADVRAWPAYAEQLSIPGAVLYRLERTRAGRKLLIELAAGQTWRSINPDTADSVLGVAPGATAIERDLGSARHITLHVQHTDPWADGVNNHPILTVLDHLNTTHNSNGDTANAGDAGSAGDGEAPGKAAGATSGKGNQAKEPKKSRRAGLADEAVTATIGAWSPGAGSICNPIPIGERPGGTTAAIPLWTQGRGALHVLIGGETGAGKSVLYRDLLTGLARCNDVIVYGIDTRKRGKAFGPWRSVMHQIGTNLVEARDILAEAYAIIQGSAEASAAEAAAGEGDDNVTPTPNRPMVVILIDEAADIFNHLADDMTGRDAELKMECVQLAENIGAAGRSEAVSLVVATQKPDHQSLGGSSALRSHFGVNICLRVRQQDDIRWVLPGIAESELDPSLFRYPGLFFLQLQADTQPTAIRSWNVPAAADCRRIADILAPGMTTLPTWLTTANSTDAAPAATPTTTNQTTSTATADTEEEDPLMARFSHTHRPVTDTDAGTPIAAGRDATPAEHAGKTAALSAAQDAIRANAAAAEADPVSDLPETPLTELARHHTPVEADPEPGDDQAKATILAALEDADDDPISRGDLVTETGLDQITVQRLLGVLERAGQAQGEDGTGDNVRWRAITPPAAGSLTALEAMPTDDEDDESSRP